MDRTSNKHGPMLDDQMKHEVESLTRGAPVESRGEEYREMEGAGEDQPAFERFAGRGEPAVGGGLSHDETETRSDVARFVNPSIFPGTRDDIITSARENNAPDAVIERLQRLPEGQSFENVQQAWEALGGNVEQPF